MRLGPVRPPGDDPDIGPGGGLGPDGEAHMACRSSALSAQSSKGVWRCSDLPSMPDHELPPVQLGTDLLLEGGEGGRRCVLVRQGPSSRTSCRARFRHERAAQSLQPHDAAHHKWSPAAKIAR